MNSETPEVICYLCNVVDDNIKSERSIDFNNSAEENKVLGICEALQSRVNHVIAVSVGRGRYVRNGGRFPAVAKRVANVAVLYAAFWQNRYFSYLVSAFSLILLLMRLKKLSGGKRICLIAYNRKLIYLPVLCYSRMQGVDCYLDLEDAPTVRDAGVIKRFVLDFSGRVFDGICNQGALFASSLLLDKAAQKRKVVCHGVVYKRKNIVLKQQVVKPVRVLFGGFLAKETGAQLLIDAVHLLNEEHKEICGRVQIVLTGHGPLLCDLQELALNDGKKWLEYHGAIDFSSYQSLLAGVDVGLCLKLPSSDMCATTFPSKVVEYASFGKAVLSTDIEDVVRLFEGDGAYILQDESARGLVNVLRKIVLEPEQIRSVAEIGQRRLIEKSGEDAVANNVMQLLLDEGLPV